MSKETSNLSVIKQITKLQKMTAQELDNVWRTMFDHEPEVNSRKHIIGKIAYRIQELAYGALDAETEDKIKACAKETQRKNAAQITQKSKKFSPQIGTVISKKYHDKIHEVMVVKEGFAYDGNVYKSLSAIAMKITGTKWNGLKFFNVRG